MTRPSHRDDPRPGGDPFPTRTYIAAMAREMARMARAEGDARLGELLDRAAEAALEPPARL